MFGQIDTAGFKALNAKWQKEHPEEVKAFLVKWRKKHPEEVQVLNVET